MSAPPHAGQDTHIIERRRECVRAARSLFPSACGEARAPDGGTGPCAGRCAGWRGKANPGANGSQARRSSMLLLHGLQVSGSQTLNAFLKNTAERQKNVRREKCFSLRTKYVFSAERGGKHCGRFSRASRCSASSCRPGACALLGDAGHDPHPPGCAGGAGDAASAAQNGKSRGSTSTITMPMTTCRGRPTRM